MCVCVCASLEAPGAGIPGVPALLYNDLLATGARSTRGTNVECKGFPPQGPFPRLPPPPPPTAASQGALGGGGAVQAPAPCVGEALPHARAEPAGSPYAAGSHPRDTLCLEVMVSTQLPHLQPPHIPPCSLETELRVPEGRSLELPSERFIPEASVHLYT